MDFIMIQPYYKDDFRTVYNKPCNTMDELPDESVQMVVTSPPYWGLRKYSGEQNLIWGNHNGCEHEWGDYSMSVCNNNGTGATTLTGGKGIHTQGGGDGSISCGVCVKCGAWRGSFGLEPTPELYVEHTIEILREIKRVLRKDGVVFWNIGDSYSGSGGTGNQFGQIERGLNIVKPVRPNGFLKPKDLCLIPFRVAIAAQNDGWWVRSDIIWNKPNAMPESVDDRPTNAHEYIFLFTKSREYYWDCDAVKEKSVEPIRAREKNNGESAVDTKERGYDCYCGNDGQRNIRDVWTFPTHGYPDAHFATFPERLPELCIKAGSKNGDVVLDTFCGSGTTLLVATKLGRKSIGYEISKDYCDLIVKRNNQYALSF